MLEVIANIATVAGDTTEIGQLAPVASDITTVAGKIGDVEIVVHLEDGTTATSAVSNLAEVLNANTSTKSFRYAITSS